MTMDTAELDRAKYVRLTTYRGDGTAVTCPVWLVRMGDAYAFTTDLDSHKVKRLRRDSRLEVSVSDVRGRVGPDALVYSGTGRVLAGAEADAVHRAVTRKYRILGTLLGVGEKLAGIVRRRPSPERGAVELKVSSAR